MRVVVCGAGTAGCVVAARLSQDPALEVTLLEVGPHYRPGRWPPALTHSHRIIKETHDWGYLARAGASPRIVHVPRGRVVGGSSVTNGAIALRGHPEHYDEWDALVDRVRVRGGRATGVETIGPDGPELLPAAGSSTRATGRPPWPSAPACSRSPACRGGEPSGDARRPRCRR